MRSDLDASINAVTAHFDPTARSGDSTIQPDGLFTERIEAVVPERSPEEITAELEEKLTSLLGTPITLG